MMRADFLQTCIGIHVLPFTKVHPFSNLNLLFSQKKGYTLNTL